MKKGFVVSVELEFLSFPKFNKLISLYPSKFQPEVELRVEEFMEVIETLHKISDFVNWDMNVKVRGNYDDVHIRISNYDTDFSMSEEEILRELDEYLADSINSEIEQEGLQINTDEVAEFLETSFDELPEEIQELKLFRDFLVQLLDEYGDEFYFGFRKSLY